MPHSINTTALNNHISAFIGEALMLLRFQFAFNRKCKFENLQQISRSDLVDDLISLKAIENDLVIRICKFDDHRRGVHSFPKAILEIKRMSHKDRVKIEKEYDQFSQLISTIKKERRNKQLAHLEIGAEDTDYEIRFNLVPVIKSIVEIIDLMNNVRVSYNWSDGQFEKFDLRCEVLNEEKQLK